MVAPDRVVGAVIGSIPLGVYLVTVAPGLGEIYALSWAHVRRLLKSGDARISFWPLDDHYTYQLGPEHWTRTCDHNPRIRFTVSPPLTSD